MQGLITLDFGNTNPHAGLFQKNQGNWSLIKIVPFSELNLYLNQLEMTPVNSQIVLSEVRAREEELFPLLQQGFLLTRVKEYWRGKKFFGMNVNYTHSLGEDRLIQAFYIFKKFKVPTLLIDAGTYVTMDVITPDGFQGGYIIPGVEQYFQAFLKGDQLKSVPLSSEFSDILPQETAKAMALSYTAFGALAQKLIKEHQIQNVILTGGQGDKWVPFFNHTDVQVEPDLIHWALHNWMITQIEPL
jgi:type III pantothenate kinase